MFADFNCFMQYFFINSFLFFNEKSGYNSIALMRETDMPSIHLKKKWNKVFLPIILRAIFFQVVNFSNLFFRVNQTLSTILCLFSKFMAKILLMKSIRLNDQS